MNYKPNTIDWKVGDIVIHDADEKNSSMLMEVNDLYCGQYRTSYINRKGSVPFYWNLKEVLHDPARFDIKVEIV